MIPDQPGSASLQTTASPLLNVRNGAAAIDFYKAAFGAVEHFRIADPEGEVVAQLRIGTTELWLADESLENANPSPSSLGGTTLRMILTVEDPDEAFQQAISAGAKLVVPVEDQPYGWRVGRVVDPFGHHWEIGKPLL